MDSIDKGQYNKLVSHPLQSYEWGEFRKKTGVKVIRELSEDKDISAFQLTIHPIPHTPFTIGYLPKGNLPTKALIKRLQEIGKQEKCILIQLEPNMRQNEKDQATIRSLGLVPSAHPLFTKYTFVLDMTKPEDELLKNMHPKARYNIRVAQKHNVTVTEDNSEHAFDAFWKLTEETTTRQKFYAHTKQYHKHQFETFPHTHQSDGLSSHILLANYQPANDQRLMTLTAWVLFVFHDTLYYPYGASSTKHKEVMANNLVMWEAIRFGKKLGLKKFDMWGALGPNPDRSDAWFGFHNFKERYGPEHVEFIGSFDLVINPVMYQFYKAADKLRWLYLRLKK